MTASFMTTRPHVAAAEDRIALLEDFRTEVKLEFASFLHDTVLQTLAAIALNASTPTSVKLLALRQDAELRAWMQDEETRSGGDFGSSLREVAADVGQRFDLYVDVVATVACPMTPVLEAVLLAAREAVINAAKHSGADRVDVFASIDGHTMSVWVRDRGIGFDPSLVADGRRGLSHSIRRRLAGVEGSADIRSAPGQGTEVALSAPIGRV